MNTQGHSSSISSMMVPWFVWDFTIPHAVCREGGWWRTGHRGSIRHIVFYIARMQSGQKSTLSLLIVSWTCDRIYIFWSFQSQCWSLFGLLLIMLLFSNLSTSQSITKNKNRVLRTTVCSVESIFGAIDILLQFFHLLKQWIALDTLHKCS